MQLKKLAFLLMFPCLAGAQVYNPPGSLTIPATIGPSESALDPYIRGFYFSQNLLVTRYFNSATTGAGMVSEVQNAGGGAYGLAAVAISGNPTQGGVAQVGTGYTNASTDGGYAIGGEFSAGSLGPGNPSQLIAIHADLSDIEAGTVAQQIGLWVANQNTGATQSYGVLVEDQTFGSNHYAISTGTGTVSFGDQVAISKGAAVASATSITPTGQIFHVTGTTAVATIVAPAGCTDANRGCQITLIPDAAFTTTAAGNIALASTAVLNKALIMTYDSGTSKWYPSY